MIKEIRKKINDKIAVKRNIEKELKELQRDKENCSKQIKYTETAQIIIQTVARQTQEKLEHQISDIVSMVLSSIFDAEFELKINYETKRNQTEIDFQLIKNGQIVDLNNVGGGAKEITSFALRMACWKLQNPKIRNMIVSDEPFKSLNDPTRELHRKLAEMIKYLSEKLELQVIMISLIPEFEEIADNIIHVRMDKEGVSQIV
jgi:DNA repair exonuclease SbcCD ATPase subunit